MKVAQRLPVAQKTVLRVTSEQYDLWYSKPVKLGTINKKGAYWYTEDGMRFASSRDALEYLIRINDAVVTRELPKKAEPMISSRSKKQAPVVVSSPAPVAAAVAETDEPINQNHPMFQQFLDFLEFNSRRKARTLDTSRNA